MRSPQVWAPGWQQSTQSIETHRALNAAAACPFPQSHFGGSLWACVSEALLLTTPLPGWQIHLHMGDPIWRPAPPNLGTTALDASTTVIVKRKTASAFIPAPKWSHCRTKNPTACQGITQFSHQASKSLVQQRNACWRQTDHQLLSGHVRDRPAAIPGK